jgi:hypothetical protein
MLGIETSPSRLRWGFSHPHEDVPLVQRSCGALILLGKPEAFAPGGGGLRLDGHRQPGFDFLGQHVSTRSIFYRHRRQPATPRKLGSDVILAGRARHPPSA